MRISGGRYTRERFCLDLALRFLRHEARTQTIRAWSGLPDNRIVYRLQHRKLSHLERCCPRSRTTDDARAFVLEAIVCAEQSLLRAAVVLSWVGAMALLHDHVIANRLADFNKLAASDPKWKPAKNGR